MDIISELYFAESDVRSFKAPSGKMYEIYGALFTNISSVTNTIGVYTSLWEDRLVAGFGDTPSAFIFRTDIAGSTLVVMLPENKPIKTKYITIAAGSPSLMQVFVTIYYELVTATKTELIWEFIRRGKNP